MPTGVVAPRTGAQADSSATLESMSAVGPRAWGNGVCAALGTAARQRGLYRMELVERMLTEHADGRRRWHYPLWTLLMLESWSQTFIDQRPRAPRLRGNAAIEPVVAKEV